ncbi:MAG: hypothetical protein IJ906_02390 [Oscillospiraceae bacterium]|nr:hypothetical protein [Oscillospiraceae bacterium]
MQRIVKYLGIWLAGVLVAALVSNFAGAFFVKKVLADSLMPSLSGYSKKMTFPLKEPQNEKEQKLNAAVLGIRALLSDTRFEIRASKFYQNFLFLDLDADQSIVFVGKDGLHDFSSGCYLSVYDESSELGNATLMKTIGLLDVAALCELDSSGELFAAVKENPDAAIRLNAYTIDNYHVTPASLTLLREGEELRTIDFPASGDAIQADTVYLYHPDDSGNSPDSLYIKMKVCRMGQHPAQKAAQALVSELSPDGENFSASHCRYGFMNVMLENTEVLEHYGMISVICIYYWKGALLYTVILSVLFAGVLVLIYHRKRA